MEKSKFNRKTLNAIRDKIIDSIGEETNLSHINVALIDVLFGTSHNLGYNFDEFIETISSDNHRKIYESISEEIERMLNENN